MKHLEADKVGDQNKEALDNIPASNFQLSMFEADPKFENIQKKLKEMDINTISPVEALLKLNEILSILKGK